MEKPFLSACLIVKNEEKVLRRCLESLQGAVDEIIVADTGSTDKTKEIASEFTPHIYDFVWIDDFSAARNFAAQHASGEWVLSVDADEYLDRDSLLKSLEVLRSPENELSMFTAEIISFTGEQGEGTATHRMGRVYRRNKVEYVGAIHEQLSGAGGMGSLPLTFYHYGYLQHVVKEKKKDERNLAILRAELRSGKATGFTYYNYGQELMQLERWEEALQAFMTAYERKPNMQAAWIPHTLLSIIKTLFQLKRYSQALTVAAEAEKAWPDSPDFLFWRGEVYRQQGRLADAKEVFHHLLARSYAHVIVLFDAKEYLPHERLAVIYEQEHRPQEAVKHYVAAMNVKGPIELLVWRLARILSKHHEAEEVVVFLEKHKMLPTKRSRLNLIRKLVHEGHIELSLRLAADEFEPPIQTAIMCKAAILSEPHLEPDMMELSEETVSTALQLGLMDLGDLCVLYYYRRDEALKSFFQGKGTRQLIPSLFQEGKAKKADQQQFLQVLEKALVAKRYAFIEYLLLYAEKYSHALDAKMADLFYWHGYSDIALNLYQSAPDSQLTKQGYENVVLWLREHGEEEEAVRIAKEAAAKFPADFRFYPYILESHALDKEQWLARALEQYPDSHYLRQKSTP
ncbi:TPR domain-containing glycosyltransferase [Ectobacillus ponti]|uniref:Glycosyltransferase n=1 Tax=Ectobacillus ponti TaxID=2961894 RepID=A0AA41X8J7_9BACI|nr:TPR domain-containing glycosyltransferase [Ectobacillus ponti]MCP8968855.1 glycosyltransferase [Ectobacillus ponti]